MSAVNASVKGLQVLSSPHGIQAVRSFLSSGSRAQRYHLGATILLLKRGPAFWVGEFTPQPGQASHVPQGWTCITVVLP